MNQRLKLLAEQADAYADAMDYVGKNYIGLRDNYFAELIVQDCVTKCDEVQAMYGQYTFTARKCKEAITEHFGVEE